MRSLTFIPIWIALVGITAGSGCRSTATSTGTWPAVGLQLQKSVTMTAGRYVEILDGLEAGEIDQAKKNMDWWLDMAIMELAALEEADPQRHWGEVKLDSDSELRMKTFYRRIAQYRKSHPRLHAIPLQPDRQRLIDAFVEKYQ